MSKTNYLKVLRTVWIFTHDVFGQKAFPLGELKIIDPTIFRLKDGDGIICYYGLISKKIFKKGDPFAPLDYRKGEGATTMEYINDEGVWQEL